MFLLSQDKDELYLTFPYFSSDYGKHFPNIEDLRTEHFLRMREYGPFRLKSRKDMSHVLGFVHNYTLYKSFQ